VDFSTALLQKIRKSLYNNFSAENFDEDRFGPYTGTNLRPTRRIKDAIKKVLMYKTLLRAQAYVEGINSFLSGLENLYRELALQDRRLLIDIIAFRLLGFRKVKLRVNSKFYKKAIKMVDGLQTGSELIKSNFFDYKLKQYDLRQLGYDANLNFGSKGIVIDYMLEQYAYKQNGKEVVAAGIGDTVLDLGACWGDTAIYFACKTGPEGKVYSFEFIPENIRLFKGNIALNPHLGSRIHLVEHPATEISGTQLYFEDKGPCSKVQLSSFEGQSGETLSISIDDFVTNNKLEKVDFIKMDIEGAERYALQGALQTIKKFRPKLAIAIYHSMEDLVEIPQWIKSLNLGYEFFLGHYTIHNEETILFAKPLAL